MNGYIIRGSCPAFFLHFCVPSQWGLTPIKANSSYRLEARKGNFRNYEPETRVATMQLDLYALFAHIWRESYRIDVVSSHKLFAHMP